MNLEFVTAGEADAPAITALRNATAERLTLVYGRGHWTSTVTEHGVLRGIKGSRIILARQDGVVVGTLCLATRRPWSIDPACFTSVQRPFYLLDMAVTPSLQRLGIGRALLMEARRLAESSGAGAIRLDAYDVEAGAGRFYAKCGYREVGRASYRGTPLVYFELLLPGPR